MPADNPKREAKGVRKPGKRPFLLSIPMNLCVYPLIILWTIGGIVVFPLLFTLWKILTGWDNSRIMRLFIWLYGRGWIVVMSPFVKFTREGFESHPIDPPCILIINHLSFFDTYCMALLPFSNIAFAVRSWPFKMLWFTPFMRLAAYLDLEKIGWVGTLEAGKKIFSKKGALLFFPEGHRSSDGKIKRFFSGPFKLAVETGVPVIPLCITGTEVLLPPGRWWLRPTRVHLTVLPSVDSRGFGGPLAHIKLKQYTRAVMAKKIAAMRGT